MTKQQDGGDTTGKAACEDGGTDVWQDATPVSGRADGLHAFFEAMPAPGFILDERLRYVRVNAALALLNGRPAAAHTGRHLSDILPARLVRRIEGPLSELRDGVREKMSFTLDDASKTRWRVHLFALAQDDRRYIAGTLEDITDMVHSERNAREHEATLRAIGDNLPDCAIFSLCVLPDGTIRPRYRSKGIAALFGVSPGTKQHAQELLRHHVIPEDAHLLPPPQISPERPLNLALRIRRVDDGSVRWVHMLAAARPQPDGSIIWDGSISDITLLKIQEHSLRERDLTIRAIGDNMPDGMLFSVEAPPAGDHNYSYVSRGVERLFGLSPEDVMRDASLLEARIAPEDRDKHKGHQQHAIATRTPFDMLLRILAADDTYHLFHVRATPRDPDGKSHFWDGVVADVTALHLTERLLQARESLLDAVGNNLQGGAIFRVAIAADETPRLLHMSRGIETVLGITAEEAIRDIRTLLARVAPEEQPFIRQSIHLGQTLPVPVDRIIRHVTTQGETRWLHMRCSMTGHDEGSQIWDGLVLDVTSHILQQRALLERETMLAAIGDNLPDGGVFRLACERASDDAKPAMRARFVHVSKGVCALAGTTPADVPHDPRRLIDHFAKDDLDAFEADLENAALTGTPVERMLRLHTERGTRWIHVRCVRSDADHDSPRWDGVCIDVTRTVEQQRALSEREAMLAAIGDNLPNGGIFRISFVDGGLRFLHMSLGIERQLGIAPSTLYARPAELLDRFDPADRATLKADSLRCLADGTPVDMMMRYTHVSGRLHWLHLRMARHESEDGARVLDGIAIDETQLVLQREALREHETTLRTLGNSLHEGAIYTFEMTAGGSRRLIYASHQASRLLDVPMERLYEDIDAVLAERIHPEDFTRFVDAETQALATLSPLDMQLRVVTPSAGLRWQHVRSAPSRLPGGGILWQGVVLDITALKRAELELEATRRHLRDIIEAMPSALFGVDTHENVTCWNGTANTLVGGPGEGAGMPCPVRSLSSIPRLLPYAALIRSSLRTGTTLRAERQAVLADGRQTYDDVVVYPLASETGTEAMVRIDDVTDRVRLEEMVVQNEKMLSIGGLAAGMAHEINNPLAGVLQGVQNVRRRLSASLPANATDAAELGISLEAMQTYMQRRGVLFLLDGIRESGERAARIVRNMLEFSRRSSIDKHPTDINALLGKVVEFASADFDISDGYDFRRVAIRYETTPDLPSVRCAPGEMEQVLVNLVRNAMHAMAAANTKDPTITLRSRVVGKRIRIEVQDNGPGMTEDVRRKVFEPFFTTKAPGKGTGLGLAVSYFIVTRFHKGMLRVESIPGEGCRFIVELPL